MNAVHRRSLSNARENSPDPATPFVKLFSLGNSSCRACSLAGSAVDAGVGVNYIMLVSLGDSSYRALTLTSSA